MPVSTIITKLHDTKIVFNHTPTIDDVPIPPANLAGCTLKFIMKLPDSLTAEVSQPATINPDGTFSYQPVLADVSTVGKFQQEWEVTYPSSQKLTFPNNGYNIVKVISDLG